MPVRNRPVRHLGNKNIHTDRRAENERISTQNLSKIKDNPEALLTKVSRIYSTFHATHIFNAIKTYLPINKNPANDTNFNMHANEGAEQTQSWQGSPEEIQQVFKEIGRNESVFSEQLLKKMLASYTNNPELAAEALTAVKASPELLSIGPGEDGRERYTTRQFFELENAIQEFADDLHTRSDHGVKGRIVNKYIKKFNLKDDQAKAIRHVLKGPDITAIVGRAGTGKSYSLRAARAAWMASGYRVLGIALAGIAADNLEKDSDIQSRTIESFCFNLKQGTLVLTYKDIVVMDEAGMTDSLSFFDVLLAIKKAKAKIVLVGDPDQLQPVGPGAAFRALLERIGFAELIHIRRQAEVWQREATFHFATGQIEKALNAYQDHGCITLADTPQKAMKQLIENWSLAIKKDGLSLKESLILAYRNVDVDTLNQLARTKRLDSGDLLPGQRVTTDKGDIEISMGERLIFLENHWVELQIGVKSFIAIYNRLILKGFSSNSSRIKILRNTKTC